MGTTNSERRYVYTIDDPGGTEDGKVLTFGSGSPPMRARERFTLANGRLVWIHYNGVAAVQS